jgi:hypothetical protein
MNTQNFHCTPYDPSKPGFYFSNSTELAKKLKTSDFEDYIIEAIDLDSSDTELFEAVSKKVDTFTALEIIESGPVYYDSEKAAFVYLLSVGYSVDKALEKFENVSLFTGELKDYAEEEIFNLGLPKLIEFCVDVELYAQEIDHDGHLHEFTFDGTDYVVTNHNSGF